MSKSLKNNIISFILIPILIMVGAINLGYYFFDWQWLNSFFEFKNSTSNSPITKEKALIYGLIMVFITVVIFILKYLIKKIQYKSQKLDSEINVLEMKISSIKDMQNSPHQKEVNLKKDIFLKIPSLKFHYANKTEIEETYSDYFQKNTVESIINEDSSEMSGIVKGSLATFFSSEAGGKKSNKLIENIKPLNLSTNKKFLDYQRCIIEENQVTLGVELVDVDSSDLDKFNETINDLNTNYNIGIDEEKLAEKRIELKEKASEKTISRLEKISGWVLIDGSFKITEIDESYKLIYNHPVNDFIPEIESHITIFVFVRKEDIEPSLQGSYTQSVGDSIPLKVYGEVFKQVSSKDKKWELQITPTAIY